MTLFNEKSTKINYNKPNSLPLCSWQAGLNWNTFG